MLHVDFKKWQSCMSLSNVRKVFVHCHYIFTPMSHVTIGPMSHVEIEPRRF